MDMRTAGQSDRGLTAGLIRWFLVSGDRLLVSFVVLLGIGIAFFVVGITGIATVTTPRRVMWYLNGTVNGLLTLVPISVGVNQIVLSHEFGSIQDLYDRRTDITEFRERVEERTETAVASPYASSFFETLLTAISDSASTIQERSGDFQKAEMRNELEELGESVSEEANRVNEELAAKNGSMIRTLLVTLSFDDTRQFHETRRVQAKLSDSDTDLSEELEYLNELFLEIDAARQFLKTVVVERQLARLSRLLIYSGIPAVVAAAIAIFSYRDIAGLTLSRPVLVVTAGTIIVVTLVPLVILGAYILRVATIALQTATYGPFIPEETEE